LGVGTGWGWRLDLGLKVVGAMYIERDGDVVAAYAADGLVLEELVETDPYALLDARLSKRIEPLGLDIYLAAENLTNTVQERRQWDIDDAAMVYAPLHGMTISLGFNKAF